MTQKYLTIKETADYLKVSYRTAQRYLSNGQIPYVKPAGRVLISEQDVIDFALMVRR